MRPTVARATVVLLAILAVAFAVPADTAQAQLLDCKPLYSEIETTWFATDQVELGWAAGMVEAGVYFKYDDAAPPIDPFIEPANLVLSSKAGNIELWVFGESAPEDGVVWRKLNILRAVGTGIYADMAIEGGVYGKCVPDVGGNYTLEGAICPQPEPGK